MTIVEKRNNPFFFMEVIVEYITLYTEINKCDTKICFKYPSICQTYCPIQCVLDASLTPVISVSGLDKKYMWQSVSIGYV
jgi:hypothetical protein